MKQLLLFILILLGAEIAMAQTVSSLSGGVTGTNIKWYSLSSGGTLFTGTETLVNNQTYYASQTVNGVESTARLAVRATVNALPTPTFTAQPGATANTNTNVTYTTESGKSNYSWTFPGTVTTDYTITSGGTSTDNAVTLKYVTPGSKTVTINYTAGGCTAASATSSSATTVSTTLIIGQDYQGGKIAYLLVNGDTGYDVNVQHGLIAATADQSAGIIWAIPDRNSFTITGMLTAIGTGSANTDKIIAQNGAGITYAAALARACADGSYSDWYLPSQDELEKLYINRVAIGGFTNNLYWSSTQGFDVYQHAYATYCNFQSGGLTVYPKSFLLNVRAVRSF